MTSLVTTGMGFIRYFLYALRGNRGKIGSHVFSPGQNGKLNERDHAAA